MDKRESIWDFRPELMSDREMIDRFHMILSAMTADVRTRLGNTRGLTGLFERLRAEEDWREIRAHLSMIREAGDRLSGEHRNLVLTQLLPLIFHENGTIRRQAAVCCGVLLSLSAADDEPVFENTIAGILFRSGDLAGESGLHTGNALRLILSVMLEKTEGETRKKVLRHIGNYFKSSRWDREACLSLLEAVTDIPFDRWSVMQRGYICDFMRSFMNGSDEELRQASLMLVDKWMCQGWKCTEDMISYLCSLTPADGAKICEHYLLARIRAMAESGIPCKDNASDDPGMKTVAFDGALLFRENLRSDDLWLYKMINLDILKRYYLTKDARDLYIYAVHLLNILRLNTRQEVFFKAGDDLVEVMPLIEMHQRYEIIQEIFKAIALRDDSSNYLPSFLGRTFTGVGGREGRELQKQLRDLSDSPDNDIVKIVAETICVIMDNYSPAEDPAGEEGNVNRRREYPGILCRCMADSRPDIAIETFYLAGDILFRNPGRALETLNGMQLVRKILIYMKETPQCHKKYYMLPVIRQICRYLDELSERGLPDDTVRSGRGIAVYSGTFDPFSMRHKAIVREVADMGYTVYLNIHSFAWDSNSTPMMIRRRIASVTVADIPGVYLLPEDFALNIENTDDLKRLRESFPGREISLVAGSSLAGMSDAYLREPGPGTIHHFPHIIYFKNDSYGDLDLKMSRKRIFGQITTLRLPVFYDDMSSVQIRENIREGKEITNQVDVRAAQMIKDWNLYADIDRTTNVAQMKPCFMTVRETDRGTEATVTDERAGRVIARGSYHETGDGVVRIDRMQMGEGCTVAEEELAFNEIIAKCQEEGYLYAVCSSDLLRPDLMENFGFLPDEEEGKTGVLDMRKPLAMFYDVATMLKNPYSGDWEVRKALLAGRERLKKALIRLFPGSLVLHFDSEILNYKISRLIRNREGILTPEETEESGRNVLCVPFGKMLKGMRIPNTVTKVLYTEKTYDKELKRFEFSELPDHRPLQTQIRMLKSMNMPIILVDDVYNKGYRMQELDALLAAEKLDVDHIIVGFMSGRGRKLAAVRGKNIVTTCVIPNMRTWLLESDLYPFVGGDGIRTDIDIIAKRDALPSINRLLPYQRPEFLHGVPDKEVVRLSAICIENARDLYRALERVYSRLHHRTLTLERIKEVFPEPRYPEGIDLSDRTRHNPVSRILERERIRLVRTYQ